MVRRGTFTPHRECPALRIVSGRQYNYYRTYAETVMLPSIAVPPLPGHRIKAEEEPPGRDSRPFPTAFIQVQGHIRDTYPVQDDDISLVLRNICE